MTRGRAASAVVPVQKSPPGNVRGWMLATARGRMPATAWRRAPAAPRGPPLASAWSPISASAWGLNPTAAWGRLAVSACGLLLALAWGLTPATAWAIDPEPPFEDARLEAEYQALIKEVRCLVCQNQTIADSNAPLASDLRREIREMMGEGANRGEVVEFLVARYGDFVLYRPRFQPSTWALWGAPAFFTLLGMAVFGRILRVRMAQPLDDEEPPR